LQAHLKTETKFSSDYILRDVTAVCVCGPRTTSQKNEQCEYHDVIVRLEINIQRLKGFIRVFLVTDSLFLNLTRSVISSVQTQLLFFYLTDTASYMFGRYIAVAVFDK
jgi:hypothetical protein